MTIREIPLRANVGLSVGNHGTTLRLTLAAVAGYIYRVEYIFLSQYCNAAAAIGTSVVQAQIAGTTYPGTLVIDRIVSTAGPFTMQRTIPCDLTMREGDTINFFTSNTSGFTVEYFVSYQVRRIQ